MPGMNQTYQEVGCKTPLAPGSMDMLVLADGLLAMYC